MDVVCTVNAHNKTLLNSGTEAIIAETLHWRRAFVEFSSRWAYHKWGKRDSIEIDHNCQTNAKYNIRQKANTVTNTKYQTTNKCQTDLDDPLPECHLKFTEKELKVQNTKDQMIIKGIQLSNTRPVCKCIYWRETGKSK